MSESPAEEAAKRTTDWKVARRSTSKLNTNATTKNIVKRPILKVSFFLWILVVTRFKLVRAM